MIQLAATAPAACAAARIGSSSASVSPGTTGATITRTGPHARTRTRMRAGTRRTLAWLHHQMQWAREDLEEAGAWPIGLAIEVDLTSDGIVEFCLPLLRRLADIPDCEPDGRAAILEAQARARASMRALAGEGHGLPAALAAA